MADKIRKLPILVVDDEAAIRKYHIASLKKEDFPNILEAGNGQEAWDLFKSRDEVPLVITDIEMPEKDGVWLIGKIREIRPATQIIIVSGFTGNSVAIHSTRSNISYLPKPVAQIYLNLGAKAAYDRYFEALWVERIKQLTISGKENWEMGEIFKLLESGPWRG